MSRNSSTVSSALTASLHQLDEGLESGMEQQRKIRQHTTLKLSKRENKLTAKLQLEQLTNKLESNIVV